MSAASGGFRQRAGPGRGLVLDTLEESPTKVSRPGTDQCAEGLTPRAMT